ncbi:MAG: glucose-6-phosphate dehydrogenase [Melioribacteraceae bacterium]|nr:glucose-6-phosphate dehydrogenase [Melioribacteraceae bacterium]
MKIPENHALVIFGASGDLTKRKLIPAVYDLKKQGYLPEGFYILGVSRSKISDEEFRTKMTDSIKEFANGDADYEDIKRFSESLHYLAIDTSDENDYAKVKEKLLQLDIERGVSGNYIYYLSTPPSLYGVIPKSLAAHKLNDETGGWKRIIIEKPFGYDLDSAIELKHQIEPYFNEDQIYRIDHFLGKETVQNVMVSRFSNGIFEPLWNRNYIQHVEITSAESIGIENRGGYYDKSGALRDMVQNHLLQLTGLIAMEAPASFDATAIRNEIHKVFKSLRAIKKEDVRKNVIRGQYTASHIKGESVSGYREENEVDENSKTETYVALKFFIDNWRWGGVPFYIRTGKRLPSRVTEAVIKFKPTPHPLFNMSDESKFGNQLVIRIQPDEGILLKFGMKTPGSGFNVQNVNMNFHYSDLSDAYIPAAYERLIHDCMIGDSTLYARGDAVEEAWKFVDPILKAWEDDPSIKVYGYPAGTWGPNIADDLIEGENLTWRYPCKNLSNDGIYCEL